MLSGLNHWRSTVSRPTAGVNTTLSRREVAPITNRTPSEHSDRAERRQRILRSPARIRQSSAAGRGIRPAHNAITDRARRASHRRDYRALDMGRYRVPPIGTYATGEWGGRAPTCALSSESTAKPCSDCARGRWCGAGQPQVNDSMTAAVSIQPESGSSGPVTSTTAMTEPSTSSTVIRTASSSGPPRVNTPVEVAIATPS